MAQPVSPEKSAGSSHLYMTNVSMPISRHITLSALNYLHEIGRFADALIVFKTSPVNISLLTSPIESFEYNIVGPTV